MRALIRKDQERARLRDLLLQGAASAPANEADADHFNSEAVAALALRAAGDGGEAGKNPLNPTFLLPLHRQCNGTI